MKLQMIMNILSWQVDKIFENCKQVYNYYNLKANW